MRLITDSDTYLSGPTPVTVLAPVHSRFYLEGKAKKKGKRRSAAKSKGKKKAKAKRRKKREQKRVRRPHARTLARV